MSCFLFGFRFQKKMREEIEQQQQMTIMGMHYAIMPVGHFTHLEVVFRCSISADRWLEFTKMAWAQIEVVFLSIAKGTSDSGVTCFNQSANPTMRAGIQKLCLGVTHSLIKARNISSNKTTSSRKLWQLKRSMTNIMNIIFELTSRAQRRSKAAEHKPSQRQKVPDKSGRRRSHQPPPNPQIPIVAN